MGYDGQSMAQEQPPSGTLSAQHKLLTGQRISFKLAIITYTCLHGLAPSYLADVSIPISSIVSSLQVAAAVSRQWDTCCSAFCWDTCILKSHLFSC